jgi:hypothetical protein
MARVRKLHSGTDEYPAWRRWMRAIGASRERYHLKTGADPIATGEPATVGLMLSAAGAAGLIGLLEYPTQKRTAQGGDWKYGRCDLWLTASRHEDKLGWAFEVKRRRITSHSPRHMLVDPFRAAWRDAGVLDVSEGSMRLACTVLYSERLIDPDSECATTLRRLAGMANWGWRISHDSELSPVYIFLKHRRRGSGSQQ